MAAHAWVGKPRPGPLVQRFLGTTHMGRCPDPARRLSVTPHRYDWFHGIDVLACGVVPFLPFPPIGKVV